MDKDAVTAPPAAPFRSAGGLVFVSGQVGVDADWVPVNETFRVEADQAFRNAIAVLERAGVGPSDILFVRTYLLDFGHFGDYNEAWTAVFPTDPPARTTVAAGLHSPFRIEIEMVAAAPG